MMEPDDELEALMRDLLTLSVNVMHEDQERRNRRLRAFALRLLHERQTAINGALDEVIANLQAGGSGGVEMVKAMRPRGR